MPPPKSSTKAKAADPRSNVPTRGSANSLRDPACRPGEEMVAAFVAERHGTTKDSVASTHGVCPQTPLAFQRIHLGHPFRTGRIIYKGDFKAVLRNLFQFVVTKPKPGAEGHIFILELVTEGERIIRADRAA